MQNFPLPFTTSLKCDSLFRFGFSRFITETYHVIHTQASKVLPDTLFKLCGCQPSHSNPPPPSAGAVWRPGPQRVGRAGNRRADQTARHLQWHSGRKHGVHTRILRWQECADNGGHRLHGKSAGGEAAEVMPGGQSPLPPGQTQSWAVHAAEGQRHDGVQSKCKMFWLSMYMS